MPVDNIARQKIYHLQDEITKISKKQDELINDDVQIRKDLSKTMESIDRVEDNTKDIVNLLKGGQVATKLLKWFVGIIISLTVIWHLFKGDLW